MAVSEAYAATQREADEQRKRADAAEARVAELEVRITCAIEAATDLHQHRETGPSRADTRTHANRILGALHGDDSVHRASFNELHARIAEAQHERRQAEAERDHLSGRAAELEAEAEELRAAYARLEAAGVDKVADRLLEETRIRSMDFRNGATMDIAPAEHLVTQWVGAARALLDGAENYSESCVEFGVTGQPERYAFVVQRVGKLTPHEARRAAEARVAELEAERTRAYDALGEHGRDAVDISGDLVDGIDTDRRMWVAERLGLEAELEQLRNAGSPAIADEHGSQP